MKLFRIVSTIAVLCLASAPALAQKIVVPQVVIVDQPGLVIIRATEIDADDCRWYTKGHTALQQFPPDVVPQKLGVFLGFCSAPGSYKVGVVVAKAVDGKAKISDPSDVTVIVGGGPVPPVPPIPPPVPPVPPVPPPPVPPPVDPLSKSLQDAYTAEVDPQKATFKSTLAEVLNNVVPVAKASGKITKAGDLQMVVKKSCDLAIGETSIPKVRAAVGAYLVMTLGTDPAKVADATFWALAASEYSKVAAYLKAVK